MVTETDASAGTSAGGAASAADTAGSFQRDAMQSQVSGQDVHTDERFKVANADSRDIFLWNQKRTGDQAQSFDLESMLRSRRIEDEERSMRLRHAEQGFQRTEREAHSEANQRMRLNYAEGELRLRHADVMLTLRTFSLAETIEEISKQADLVVERLKKA